MSAAGRKQWIEPVLQLIFDGREDEALSAITLEFGKSSAEELGFLTAAAGSLGQRGGSEKPDKGRPKRVRLANLYRLSVFVMDKESWDSAITALGWTIKLSEDMDEVFFLEDCRFRKALCHQVLGQRVEMLKEKAMVSADKTFFIGDKILGIGDLD